MLASSNNLRRGLSIPRGRRSSRGLVKLLPHGVVVCLNPAGEIVLRPEEELELPGVLAVKRANVQRAFELYSSLGVVRNRYATRFFLLDKLPHRLALSFRRIPTLQEPAILPDNLIHGVPGK